MGPACARHRSAGRSRSCPLDTRTRGRPVRGKAWGEGSTAGPAQALRLRRPRPCRLATPSAFSGRRGSGRWAGPWLRGWLRPRGFLLGDRGRPLYTACLLARTYGRRAPLVCSDLGTKFKDFKSTSWRLLRATARRSGLSPLSCGRRHFTCVGARTLRHEPARLQRSAPAVLLPLQPRLADGPGR